MQRLRKGDEIIILSGNDKGARGQIESVIYDANRVITHVIVDGVNLRWKHSRGNPARNDQGGRLRKEAPLPVGKVALYNEEKKGPDRVRIQVTEGGKRERVFASTGGKV